jgi:flavin-dependent dehydrogenase
MPRPDFDVAIIGGGLAGSMLARQLHRTNPKIRIGVFEKEAGTSYKVGESTVEVFSNYMVRKLGLSTYLYEHHLPKNGLRFFFDSPDRSTRIDGMSEIGSAGFPLFPSFQVDRLRLEADLRRMNAELGVVYHEPAAVLEPRIGEEGEPHTFAYEHDGSRRNVSSRWLIDASGRAKVLGRALDLHVPGSDHKAAAAWGRFRSVRDMDDVGPADFGLRVRNTSRRLSTVHFCYPGYWIWLIPLRGGITSVGLVCHRDQWQPDYAKRGGFMTFLNEHEAVRDVLEGAEIVDFGSFGRLSYGTKQFFGDRWGLTGEAAAFTDPFYSPGSDFIALENDFLTDLITRDLGGEDAKALAERTRAYDQYMAFRFQANLLLYTDMYPTLGSYELFNVRWQLDMSCYYNLWLASYIEDKHLDLGSVRQELRGAKFVLAALRQFNDLFREVTEHMRTNETYFDSNTGKYAEGLAFMETKGIGRARQPADVQANTFQAFCRAREDANRLLGKQGEVPIEEQTLDDYITGRAFR